MGRTLVQWASHATWSAPRRAACIGISQQWRAYLTDGNSVTQAQVTSIKKNFINLTVLAGEQKLHSGRASGGTSGHSRTRDARCWHFWAPGGRYAAVDASAPWLELKAKLWFRDRGRAFFGQIGILAPRVCLARFTDSPVVSTQPDPRFSPVNTLPLCIKLLLYARLLLLAPRDETTRCRRWPPSFHMTELRLALLFSLSCLLAQVRLRASTPSFVVRVSFPRRHRSLLQFPQS